MLLSLLQQLRVHSHFHLCPPREPKFQPTYLVSNPQISSQYDDICGEAGGAFVKSNAPTSDPDTSRQAQEERRLANCKVRAATTP